MYIPNLRAMAVGEVLKPAKAQQTRHINNPPPNFDIGEHSISGYFGCSGAMIATFREAKLDDPVIIGICKLCGIP